MSLLSTAHAATTSGGAAGQAQQPSMLPLIVIAVVIVLFYIWMFRKQKQKTQQQKNVLDNLSKGDEVMTTGGIIGKIVSVDANHVVVEVSKDTEITFQKNAVSTVLPKGTLKTN